MDQQVIRLGVLGAAGRMGQEVLRSLGPADGFEILLAVDRAGAGQNCRELAGPKAPDILIEEKLGAALDRTAVDVLIDFSHHSGVAAHSTSALQRGISPVIGCTGLSDSDVGDIRAAVRETGHPALIVPNFAIGAVLMMKFSEMAARWLPDAEILELHHEKKEDAPSGTAMLTAELISEARTKSPTRKPTPFIKAEGALGGLVRGVPVHSVRLPGFLAHQQVMFGTTGETLTIRHDSTDRSSFMPGVMMAARRVRGLSGLVIGLDKLMFE